MKHLLSDLTLKFKQDLQSSKESLNCVTAELVSMVIFMTMGIVTANVINFEAIGYIETIYFIEASFYALLKTLIVGGFIYRKVTNRQAVRNFSIVIASFLTIFFILLAPTISQMFFKTQTGVKYIVMLAISNLFIAFYYEAVNFVIFYKQSRNLIKLELIFVISQVLTTLVLHKIFGLTVWALGWGNIVSYLLPWLIFVKQKPVFSFKVKLTQIQTIFRNNFDLFIDELGYALVKLPVIYVILKYQTVQDLSLLAVSESFYLLLCAPMIGLGNNLSYSAATKNKQQLASIIKLTLVITAMIYIVLYLNIDNILFFMNFTGNFQYGRLIIKLALINSLAYIPISVSRDLSRGKKIGQYNNLADLSLKSAQIILILLICSNLVDIISLNIILHLLWSIVFVYIFIRHSDRNQRNGA